MTINNTFDVSLFMKGVPAISRNGCIVHFTRITSWSSWPYRCEWRNKHGDIVKNSGVRKDGCYINGSAEREWDCIGMAEEIYD